MKLLFRLAALLLLVIAVLAAVVLGKSWWTPSRQLAVAPETPVAIDMPAASARLAAAVRLQTISSPTDPDAQAPEFLRLHTQLQSDFPKAHAVLTREVVGTYGLLYTWPGKDPKALPIALLAHQDVVPIAPGTEADWVKPPFSGAVHEGALWGRGAWDNKGNLMAVMESVEMLVASGFQPQQTVYLVFGHDEEVGGNRGAKQIANLLQQRGVKLDFVLDEGLLITENVLAGLDKPAALVGVAEKGYLTLLLTAKAAPGHSSMPPGQPERTSIGMMSAALARLEDQQMPAGIRGLTQEMFETLAPEMGGLNRIFLSNLWLFKPVVEQQLQKSASSNAIVRTTTALTVVQAGNKDNVLPGQAHASVNFRLLPGDTSEAVVQHTLLAIANPAITLERGGFVSEASKVSRTEVPAYGLINRTIRQLHPDTIVAPGLMLGATDSRHFDGIANNVYRFSPVRARGEDLSRFHGTNERITLANYAELIQFYHLLLRNSAQLVSSSAPVHSS